MHDVYFTIIFDQQLSSIYQFLFSFCKYLLLLNPFAISARSVFHRLLISVLSCFWSVFGNAVTVFDQYLISIWPVFDQYLTGSRQYLINIIKWVFDQYFMNIWSVFDQYFSSILTNPLGTLKPNLPRVQPWLYIDITKSTRHLPGGWWRVDKARFSTRRRAPPLMEAHLYIPLNPPAIFLAGGGGWIKLGFPPAGVRHHWWRVTYRYH